MEMKPKRDPSGLDVWRALAALWQSEVGPGVAPPFPSPPGDFDPYGEPADRCPFKELHHPVGCQCEIHTPKKEVKS